MENPTLTFLTPTFIAGDQSLVGLVAHELAHSWSGNLVTNATWADSWLNEGFTSYFENRIMEALYGPKRAAQEAALSFDDMEKALAEEGATAPITRLHLAEGEAVPDGGASGIVYDKGAIFLRTIERPVGRERFDAYLRSYFDRHAFQPMTSALFLADLRANLVKGDEALERKLQLDHWVYQPGLPANAARPDPAAFADGRPGGRRLRRRRRRASGVRPAGPPPSGCASSTGCRASCRQPRLDELDRQLRPQRGRQQRSAVRLARAGARQPLRPGGAGAGALPDRRRAGASSCGRCSRRLPKDATVGPADRGARSTRVARPSYHPITTSAISTS